MGELRIEGDEILAVSPEGKRETLKLDVLYERVAGLRMETGGLVLPDGVKAIRSDGSVTIWVHQTPPRVYKLKWIAKDSPSRFGKDCTYRDITIGLPYMIVLAVFTRSREGYTTLSKLNECFFTNQSLTSLQDPLFYPALLNCSKFDPPDGKPLSWICTQHLVRDFDTEPDENVRLRRGFIALMRCLMEAGFNYSSEEHEASSWFTESSTVSPDIADIDKWQEATKIDPLFVLDLDWLPTNHSVEEVIQRIFKQQNAKSPKFNNAKAIERLVFSHKRQKLRRAKLAKAAEEQPDLAGLIQEF
ncbi:MAG: hypothetical protein AAGH89_03015 [Verrucomicrobiota bacterium]